MESRMEKYHEVDIEQFQRSKKNADLYKEVYGNYDSFENLPISENTNEINIENLKSLMGKNEYPKRVNKKEKENNFVNEKEELSKEEKVYDINTLLENAKKENAKIKKESTINKNIPNYLANLESDKNTKEIILKYDGDNDDDLPIVKEIKYMTSEINFSENSINTSSLSLDILSDLKPTGNTMVSEPIKEEIDLLIEKDEEKEFFDNKLDLSGDDFEEVEEDNDELFYEETEHSFVKILLLIIILALIFTASYFVLKEYTNIF